MGLYIHNFPPYVVLNRLAEFRKKLGITQTDLADFVGCSKNTISLIETGQQIPTLGLAFAIVSIFGVTIEDVFQFRSPRFLNVGD